MTDLISTTGADIEWGEQASDVQVDVLRDYGVPEAVAGDSEWLVAVSVYVLDTDLVVDDVTVPAGTYIRTVDGKQEQAWQVDGFDWAVGAYVDAVEAAWLLAGN